jgi:hypothetical protein
VKHAATKFYAMFRVVLGERVSCDKAGAAVAAVTAASAFLNVRIRIESRSGTGTVTETTKVRLEAVAYLPGTDGSNPFPSTGESHGEFAIGGEEAGFPVPHGSERSWPHTIHTI